MSLKTKNRNTAILLAVFFSYWCWAYVYKQRAINFWISLIASILFFWTYIIPIGIWIWAMADMTSIKNSKYYRWDRK